MSERPSLRASLKHGPHARPDLRFFGRGLLVYQDAGREIHDA